MQETVTKLASSLALAVPPVHDAMTHFCAEARVVARQAVGALCAVERGTLAVCAAAALGCAVAAAVLTDNSRLRARVAAVESELRYMGDDIDTLHAAMGRIMRRTGVPSWRRIIIQY